LHVSVAAIFPIYASAAATGVWRESTSRFLLEYLPAAAVGLWALRSGGSGSRAARFGPIRTVSIVIPVRNEAENLAECIAAIRAQGRQPLEILVVDGGSKDGTADIAQALPGVTLYRSEPGRGVQIARGVSRAVGDVVLALHADTRLLPDAMDRMLRLLSERPDAAGGAFGAGDADGSLKFKLIAALNNFRARILGISFGDQAQFFRRGALASGFPALRLMEDVELSLRMKEAGSTLFIPGGAVNSTRRWARRGYAGNGLKVIWLTSKFILYRRFGVDPGDGGDFYRSYYGKSG
jgi:glycosyltransferase involved in cell wall biosynthesis